MEIEKSKEVRSQFNLYLDKKTRQEMKLKEVMTGIKYQDKIRAFIKEDLKNEE